MSIAEEEDWERLQRVMESLALVSLSDACPTGRRVDAWYGNVLTGDLLGDDVRLRLVLADLPALAQFERRAAPGVLVGPLVVDRAYGEALHERLVARYDGVPVTEFRWPLPDDAAVACVGWAVPGRTP